MSGTLYLLDTTILLALVRGNELGKFIRHKFSLDNPTVRSLISIVSHGEIWAMAQRHNWQAKKQEVLERMLDSLVTVDLNASEIVRAYVEIDRLNQSVRRGARQLSNNDRDLHKELSTNSAPL